MDAESAGAEGRLKTTPVPAGPGATGARGLREAASRSDHRSGPRPCRPKSRRPGWRAKGRSRPRPGRVAASTENLPVTASEEPGD